MTLRTSIAVVLIAGLGLYASAGLAADPAAGKQQYQATCAACHGSTGISIAPIYPDVAGQKREYLVAQMKAFRDGSRVNAIMQPMAKGLSDTDIANIAEYLAALGSPAKRLQN